MSVAALGITLVIVLDCLMTFFGSSANDAAFNAWLTDSTDETNRGSAEGINSMMPLVAILVVFGGFMFIPKEGNDAYWPTVFTIIGLAVMALFKPRTWCTFCPMGTMTQTICKIKAKEKL